MVRRWVVAFAAEPLRWTTTNDSGGATEEGGQRKGAPASSSSSLPVAVWDGWGGCRRVALSSSSVVVRLVLPPPLPLHRPFIAFVGGRSRVARLSGRSSASCGWRQSTRQRADGVRPRGANADCRDATRRAHAHAHQWTAESTRRNSGTARNDRAGKEERSTHRQELMICYQHVKRALCFFSSVGHVHAFGGTFSLFG